MNTKKIITTCLLLLGTMAVQAQELIPFKEDFSIPAKFGFKDKNGNVIIEPLYSKVGKFSEGIVRLELDVLDVVSWEYRDIKGNRIGKLSFTGAKDFSEGYAAVQMGNEFDGNVRAGNWGFIDKTGREVIAPIYNNAHSFSEGYAAVQSIETKKWGFIDKTGNEVIPFVFDRIGEGGLFPNENSRMFKDGKILVRKDGSEFFIDKTGKGKYDYVSNFEEGLARVKLNEKWGVIDKTHKEVVPPRYDYISTFFFNEGLASVQLNKKWGFIDKTGKEVIPLIYDYADDFKDGKAIVEKDGKEFFIDKTGKEIEDNNAVFNKMATAYQSGNFTEAFKLAEQLANKHNADAMNLLGNMHAQGQGTKQNYGMARSWWEMASNKGNAAATGNIGLLYAQGWGVPQNMAEAEKWFKKGADLGDPQSMFNLGNLAFQKGNLTEARQWIQKAKTAGHPQADVALQQINAASANQQQHRRDKN